MRVFVVISLFVSIATAAIAQDEETMWCCTTYDTSVCLSKIHDKIEADLNTTYQKALDMTKRFGEQDVQNLKDAEQSGRSTEMRPAKLNMGYGAAEVGDPMHALCA